VVSNSTIIFLPLVVSYRCMAFQIVLLASMMRMYLIVVKFSQRALSLNLDIGDKVHKQNWSLQYSTSTSPKQGD